MVLEWFHDTIGQSGDSVFLSLVIPYDDLFVAEIQVFDTQS